MHELDEDTRQKVHALIDRYRLECMWYVREDFYPTDVRGARYALDCIMQYGDLTAFKQAGELREWLLAHSNGPSAS